MLDDLTLGAPVVAALRLAATERPDGAGQLTTGRVLAALIRVDSANYWQRIWLETGDPLTRGLADEPDSPAVLATAALGPGGRELERWQGVPLSAALANALRLLARISFAYRLVPAPSGALTLALLADPSNGATRVLLRSGVKHGELLGLVQSELLGDTLEGVSDLIADRPLSRHPSIAPGQQPGGRQAAPDPGCIPARDDGDAARVAAMMPAETGRRAGRREVRRWRILSALALALIGIALFWHRQFLPPPTALVLPPYPVPAVAHQVLTTTELPALPAEAGGWLPMQDGPPTSGVWVGSGRFRADLRNQLYVGAWQRTWDSTDGQDTMQVAAYETRARAGAVSFLPSQCKPQQQVRLPGATVAGYVIMSQQGAEACAVGLRGRTVLAVTVWANGRGASDFAWQALREGLGRELPKAPATARDLPPVSELSSPTRIAILSTLMGAVLGIPLLLGLITVARDRQPGGD